MLWRGLERDAAPRTQLLVPPAAWNLPADDAQVILTALATAIRSGLAVPRPLPAVIADAAASTEPPEPAGAYASARGRFNDDVTAADRRPSWPAVGTDLSVDHRRAHRA